MNDVDWIPALVVLAAGLLAGAAYAWRARRAVPAPAAPGESPSLVARDLQGKLDALFQQLRELDFAAAKRSPEQLAAERRALELDAARTLRELDGLAPALEREAPAVARTPAATEGARPPATAGALRGFLWGTGTVAALGLLLFLVSRSAEERREGATVTGNTPMDGRPGEGEGPDAEVAALRAAVERSPEDLEARLDLARAYLARQDMMGVFNETKFVLERSPAEPRALSYQALVRLAMGQPEIALEMLRQALQAQPDFVEGYVHLAIVYSRMGRAKEAERTMEGAIRRFPAEAETLRELADAIRRATPDPASVAAAEADPHRAVPPPPGVGAPVPPAPRRAGAAAAPPASASPGVSGTVDLDPDLKGKVQAGGVLFVMARPDGFGAGPPLAAKRIAVASFPVAFHLSSADSMMGDVLPEKVLLEARLDGDGDPTTRDPSDPYASLDGVALGSERVSLVLRRPAP